QAIEAGGGIAQITLSKELKTLPLTEQATPSQFTSWGATPELDFRPHIAGIGGEVYSTLNNNTYASNSGTSMASPHVAGVFALGLDHYRDRYSNLTAAERNTLLRTAMANTAKILEHTPGQPYAPRQIGAGLVQTQDALTTTVYATVDGEPHVALRQIDGPRTFTITLTNRGDRDHTFTTGSTCV
ncbi:S8 family serine peptidase, partial [Arachnia propionica]